MNILLVDDNTRIRGTIKNIISQPGIKCYECNDGAEALECYRNVKPEWTLMDIVMPGMDGLKAMENIISEFPGASIIVVTNYDDTQYRTRAAQLGAKGYVLKENLIELRKILQCKNN